MERTHRNELIKKSNSSTSFRIHSKNSKEEPMEEKRMNGKLMEVEPMKEELMKDTHLLCLRLWESGEMVNMILHLFVVLLPLNLINSTNN